MHIRRATHADAAAIAHVNVSAWNSTYRGHIPDHVLDAMDVAEYQRRWEQRIASNALVFVAEVDGQVVGYVNGGKERSGNQRYTSEVYSIYVLPEHQRRGIGQALFRAFVQHMHDHHAGLLVWVLASNPARQFYAAIGGQEIGTKQEQLDGAVLDEVGYGWSDVRPLLGDTSTADDSDAR